MTHGSLDVYLRNPQNKLGWPQRLAFAQDIAAGMHFLHTFNPPIIHRDLKSPNVLVCSLSLPSYAQLRKTRSYPVSHC
jgi:serine/threonine protein kinase